MEIGIIGAGEIVRQVHLPVLLSMPEVRVAWIFDASPQRAAALGEAYGVRAVQAAEPGKLPACDVALLAIPLPAREPYLRALAERGVAVLCEKPFAASAEEHARYLGWFAPHALGCGYMRRFHRSTRALARVLRAGWFGAPRAIVIGEGGRSRGSGSAHSFLEDRRLAAVRGVLMDLGTHSLDLALQLCAPADFQVSHAQLLLDADVDRHAAARVALRGDAGAEVALDWSVSWLESQTNRIELHFTETCVWSALAPGAELHIGDPRRPGDAARIDLPVEGAMSGLQAFHLEWRDFLDGVRRRQPSLVSAASALQTTALAEAIRLAPQRAAA